MSAIPRSWSSANEAERRGKLAALQPGVTAPPDSSLISRPSVERFPAETAAFADLCAGVAKALLRQAPEISARWERQAREVALREPSAAPTDDRAGVAIPVIGALADALAADGAVSEEGVALGLAYGAEAFEEGASLHHMLKGLDLIGAMVLYAVETEVSTNASPDVSVADGVRLSRRLQRTMSLLTLACTKGYTQAVDDGLRDQFRHLRHDLRNPLGTIKSVLALMDDETMPADARSHPRFRAMAKRNARSLEELIGNRLSDASAQLPAMTQQSVSLRTLACGVRRELRAEWEMRDVSVAVANRGARVRADSVTLELLLRTVLLGAIQEAADGDELAIDFQQLSADRAAVVITCDPARPPIVDPAVRQRLTALATQMGVRVEFREQVVISFVARRGEAADAPTESVVAVEPRSNASAHRADG